jgi:lysophospholipase L1-like esterase
VSLGSPAPLHFVALGDSYTIGTATRSAAERWPNQLVARLRSAPPAPAAPALELVANLGVNGFTSRDVIEAELPELQALEPGFVTVLVGVNDVVQGVPEATYRENVTIILDELLSRLPPNRLLVITTPDYTVTPRGGDFGDPMLQAAEIRRFNGAIAELASGRGVGVVDIHDVSLEAAADRSLVADDGLHPSRAQYARWVDRIAPVVEDLLKG